MVAPQYVVAAMAVGVVCAIAYTLYTTLSGTQRPHSNRRGSNSRGQRFHRNENPPRSQCEICQRPVLNSLTLSCGHEFHKPCLLSVGGASRVNQTYPHVCITCWTTFSPSERRRIITMDNEVCTICLFAVDDNTFILDCGHEFHQQCAEQMLNHAERKCPNCREELCIGDLRRLASGV